MLVTMLGPKLGLYTCDQCEREFERKISKKSKSKHFCTRECSHVAMRLGGVLHKSLIGTKKRSRNTLVSTETSADLATLFRQGITITALMARFDLSRNRITKLLKLEIGDEYSMVAKWVSQKARIDASIITNKNREYVWSREVVEQRAKSNRGQKRSAEALVNITRANQLRRQRRTPESYRLAGPKIRETKRINGSFERHSKFMALAMANGTHFSNAAARYGVKSQYTSSRNGVTFQCDSNFERQRMIELDADANVVSWTKKHGIVLTYTVRQKTHRYVPDFLILMNDGSILLQELKGWSSDDERNLAKFEALKAYCDQKGMKAVWTWQTKQHNPF